MTEPQTLTVFGGPYAGELPAVGLPSDPLKSYHTVGDSDATRGDCALYEVVGLTAFFVGFHRELWPDHPDRFRPASEC